MINDILDISKIEAGQLQLEERDFDLREVVEGSAEIAAVTAREKELELTVYVHDNVPRAVRGDSVRLAQVLTNLLSNAVKFTSEGEVGLEATVRVEVERHAYDVTKLATNGQAEAGAA